MMMCLSDMTTTDINKLIKVCNEELEKRKKEKYDNLRKNVLIALEAMAKEFPDADGAYDSDGYEINWKEIYDKIKNFEIE